MKKAIVYAELPDSNNLIRKTVVIIERNIDELSGQEIESIQTIIILMDNDGALHEAYEVQQETQIPESEFPEPHIIPIPAPNDHTIYLNTQDPGRSESRPN